MYFFSLDAARSLAVVAARAVLNLPYYTAAMSVERGGEALHYQSARLTVNTMAMANHLRLNGPPALLHFPATMSY